MKNKNRLTVEEVNEFKPSFYNPLEVECDDGFFTDTLKIVKIITPVLDDYCICINTNDEFKNIPTVSLKHYPSQKQEREKFYIWRYDNNSKNVGTTGKYYSKEFRDTGGTIYILLKNSPFKEICTEFRPIYSDGSYADE